jgi:replicative superfamily II helicase
MQSVTGDGKTVIAIGEILARCFGHRQSSRKAFLAVPYRRLAREKGEEMEHVFTTLRQRPPRRGEIRVVEGRRPVRDITQTRVVIGTFEHIL